MYHVISFDLSISHMTSHITNPNAQLLMPTFPLWFTDTLTGLGQLPNWIACLPSSLGNTPVRNSRTWMTERYSDLTVTWEALDLLEFQVWGSGNSRQGRGINLANEFFDDGVGDEGEKVWLYFSQLYTWFSADNHEEEVFKSLGVYGNIGHGGGLRSRRVQLITYLVSIALLFYIRRPVFLELC